MARYRGLLSIVVALKIIVLSIWFWISLNGSLNGVHAEMASPLDKAGASVEESQTVEKPQIQPVTFEDELIKAIQRRELELDEREEALRLREEKLLALKRDIEAKLAELRSLKEDIESALNRIEGIEKKRLNRIVKIYEAMPPEDAAIRIERLDEDMAVRILSVMKEKKAGEILALVGLEKSVKLSQLLNKKVR